MDSFDSGVRKCNYCGEEINALSTRCPYCGSLLQEAEQGRQPEASSQDNVMPQTEERRDEAPVQSNPELYGVHSFYGNGNWTDSRMKQMDAYTKPQEISPLSNGIKVLLTTLSVILPGIGQLIGIIASVIFLNSDDDKDRRSFGISLMIASICVFIITCIFYGLLIILLAALKGY